MRIGTVPLSSQSQFIFQILTPGLIDGFDVQWWLARIALERVL